VRSIKEKIYVWHPLRNAWHAYLMTSPLFPSLGCNFEIDIQTLKLARLVIKKSIGITMIFETEARDQLL